MKKQYDMSKAKKGPVIKGKTRITIYLDNAVLAHFHEKSDATRQGYQTLINNTLRQATENQLLMQKPILDPYTALLEKVHTGLTKLSQRLAKLDGKHS